MSTTVVLANDHRTAQLENQKLARELVDLRRENEQLRALLADLRAGGAVGTALELRPESTQVPRFARSAAVAAPVSMPNPIITNRDGTTVQVIERPQRHQAAPRASLTAPEPGTIHRNADGSTVQFLGRSLTAGRPQPSAQAPRVEAVRPARSAPRPIYDEGQDDSAMVRANLLELE